MLRCRMSALADAPVHKVFSYLADFQKRPEWVSEEIESVEKTSQGPVGVGSTFTIVTLQDAAFPETSVGQARIRSSLVVTEFVPNERIAWEAKVTGGSIHNFIEVRPSDGGALVTMGSKPARISFWMLPVVPLIYFPSPQQAQTLLSLG